MNGASVADNIIGRVSICAKEGSNILVLSRKRDEAIIINDEITITVVDIRGDKVRLGVEAPKDVPVNRKEVHEAIQREKRRDEEKQKARDGSAS